MTWGPGKSETLAGFPKHGQLIVLSLTSTCKNATDFGSGQKGPRYFGFSSQNARRKMVMWERKRVVADIIACLADFLIRSFRTRH